MLTQQLPKLDLSGIVNTHFLGQNNVVASEAVAIEAADTQGDAASSAAAADRGSNT